MFSVLHKIAANSDLQLIEAKALAGGDINQVFLLKCAEGRVVVKINDATKFPGMFAAEAKGLQLLRKSSPFKIPEILHEGELENISYLLMEYISSGQPASNFWQQFAENLVTLHKTSQKQFGLDHDNYIGSLPQQNGFCVTAADFYITQRLQPQFKLAANEGFHFKNLSTFFKNISDEIPIEPPSLIHGDLWNGNYMVSENGLPVMIDPATAFAPREMDIAMMQLFGGFPEEVFVEYNTIFPLAEGWKNRLPLWQLYHLLVHLNLFGSGYLPQVNTIVKRFL